MTSNLQLTINNLPTSGAPSNQVYLCIVGSDPSQSGQFGYLDFATGSAVFSPAGSWQLHPSTMVTTLDQLTFPLAVPPLGSARIYLSVYGNFAPFPASGPSPSTGNAVLFDKIEFDNTSDPNINTTCVDFYGLSYVLSGYDNGLQGQVSYGFAQTRAAMIAALNDFTPPKPSQETGNTGMMKRTFLKDGSNHVLRVLAPKTMALTDWGATQQEYLHWATRCSHFLDAYVKKHCFKPSRKFSFYSTNYVAGGNNPVYWGTTSADGLQIHLWTDAACTQPYSPVPSLNLPAATWPLPSMQSLYHNVAGDQGSIDWGFLLLGNSAGTGAGANWGSDPLCMAILVSICRGVMHLDDGTVSWINPANYYQGQAGASTEDMPIFYYSSILHANGLNGKAYALSYDDIYGTNPSIFFAGHPNITIDLHGLDQVDAPQ